MLINHHTYTNGEGQHKTYGEVNGWTLGEIHANALETCFADGLIEGEKACWG